MTALELLLVAGALLSVSGYAIYGAGIRRGLVEPNIASWLIWSATTAIEAFTYEAVNSGTLQTVVFIVSAIACLLVTFSIWQHSRVQVTSFGENFCMFACGVAVVVWLVFNQAWWAHIIVLVSIPISFWPTFVSAWHDPEHEQSPAWGLWTLGDMAVLGYVMATARQDATELPYVVLEFAAHATVWALVGLGSINPARTLRIARGRLMALAMDETTGRPFFIGRTRVGKAVFAGAPLRRNEVITRFRGRTFSAGEIPETMTSSTDRFVQIDVDRFMGPSGGVDDLINHSCAPNAGLFFVEDGVYLLALRDIARGEEVTWDYSTTILNHDWSMTCRCGSRYCRRSIGDYRTLPVQRVADYERLGVFPDYVMHAIEADRAGKVVDLFPRVEVREDAPLDRMPRRISRWRQADALRAAGRQAPAPRKKTPRG